MKGIAFLQYIINAELKLQNVQIATEFSTGLFLYLLNASGLEPVS